MSLAQTHAEYITEQLMLEYLYSGEVPTAEQLEADLAAYQEEHPNLEEPTSKAMDFSVGSGNNSSAALIQSIADTFSQDVGIVTREIYRVAEASSRFYDRWSTELKRLSLTARKLEDRVDALLLLNQDTAGFFAAVGDVFADMNQVDTEETTARINLHEASVYIDPSFSELENAGSLIKLTDITENDVSFSPLTTRPGIAYTTTNEGNALSNIFKADNSAWVGKVYSDTGGEVVCELKAKLANEDLEVSKITMRFVGPLGTTKSTVTCMVSEDGYTWSLVRTAEATKSLSRNMSWLFPMTTMRWVKFIFRKPAPDNPANEYMFAASHIHFYGNNYTDSVGDTLITQGLQAFNAEGNPVRFSLVALEVCSELPDNTGINYYISASKDNSTWTDWFNILAADSDEILYPKIINLSGADWKDNLSDTDTDLLDETATADRAQMKLTRSFSNATLGDSLLGYRFKSISYGVVNTAIIISPDEDPDPVGGSVVVWRNVRHKDITDYPDILTVRGNPRGWGIDGSMHTCYFEVVSSDGILLDFGDRECVIDGARASGVVKISQGVHKFATDADNWKDISEDLIAVVAALPSTTLQNEEQLRAIDPLYPHNHKLVIEGFPYSTNFKGERKYLGTDRSAEFYATRTSMFELENNIQEYGYFAVRGVGDETNPVLAVVAKFDPSNTDWSNELFVAEWRSGASNAEMYQYIRLKAGLWTEDSGVSPVLSSYRIKLGV
jgi:hypothetical protein